MNNEKIGNFIKDLRNNKNITQDELSRAIYVSRNNLSDIENGKTTLSPDKAKSLAKYFNISLIDLYNGEITDKKNKKIIDETIDIVSENLIKESKKKYTKKLLSIIVVFTIIIILFLVYYFLYSYNSVKVYKVLGKSENFNTNDGLFFVSKEELYFSLSVESEKGYEIDSLTLKYKTDDKDELVQKITSNSFFIVDSYGYNEYFNYDDIVNEEGTFYLEIEYDENIEILDLSVAKQYENNNLLLKKQEPIDANDGMYYTTSELFVPEKILSDFTYDEEGSSYGYQEEKDDYTLYLGYIPDSEIFTITESYDNFSIDYLYWDNDLYYSEYNSNGSLKEKNRIITESSDYELYKYFIDNYYNIYLK